MTHAPDVVAVCERLREQGVDVVRVSYPDLIGVDRGRDVLVDELAAAAAHGLAFCRAVYHTSPMGDVVPVQGGLEMGLPDITVHPDFATLTPMPWEPNAAWCLGDASLPDGQAAPESPRAVARRVAEQVSGLGYTLICGPELEFVLCEPWLIDWGLDNRSAMVRIPPERGPAARMEVRLGDATANPYLAMAAVGAAVYLGVRYKTEPPAKLEGYGYDAARSPLLPTRLSDALDALESDRDLAAVLGEYFVASFLAYKRNEIERFERFVTDWEFREYAYHL